MQTRISDILEKVDQLKGRFPSEVIDIDRTDIIENDLTEKFSSERINSQRTDINLLEHPALFEWRFSKSSAARVGQIASSICSQRQCSSVRCLGCPTVALEMSSDMDGRTVVLEDANSVLLQEVDRLTPSFVQTTKTNVCHDQEYVFNDHCNICIADPPWYFDYYVSFLSYALSSAVFADTIVLMPLLPRGSRSKARSVRQQVMSLIYKWGGVAKRIGSVRYVTPSFEANVLDRLCPVKGTSWNNIHWRTAPLFMLLFEKPARYSDEIINIRRRYSKSCTSWAFDRRHDGYWAIRGFKNNYSTGIRFKRMPISRSERQKLHPIGIRHDGILVFN